MPSYEYIAWVTVHAPDRQAADLLVEEAADAVYNALGGNGTLSIDDGEPIEEDDDDDD